MGVPEVQSSNRDPNGLFKNSKSGHIWKAVNRKTFTGTQGALNKS